MKDVVRALSILVVLGIYVLVGVGALIGSALLLISNHTAHGIVAALVLALLGGLCLVGARDFYADIKDTQ